METLIKDSITLLQAKNAQRWKNFLKWWCVIVKDRQQKNSKMFLIDVLGGIIKQPDAGSRFHIDDAEGIDNINTSNNSNHDCLNLNNGVIPCNEEDRDLFL